MMKRFGKTLFWWLTFGTATVALSKVFEASRGLTAESGDGSVTALLLWGLLLALSFLVLGYESYVKSKTEGKVIHRIGLFETLYQYQHRGRSD